MRIHYPNNVNKTEDLSQRVVLQSKDRFKNKHQILFFGTRNYKYDPSQSKPIPDCSMISFIILSYACYQHEGVQLLKRLSRSAFLMTQNRELLAQFAKKTFEIPLFSNNSLVYVKRNEINAGIKLVDPK